MTSAVLTVVLRTVLSLVFLGAGISKALDPASFALAIERYRLLPWPLCATLALYLPWLEILAALGLWRRSTQAGAYLLLAGLSALFFGALASALMRGLDISCGCFGENHETSLGWALARAGLLTIVAIFCLKKEVRQNRSEAGKRAGCPI